MAGRRRSRVCAVSSPRNKAMLIKTRKKVVVSMRRKRERKR